MAKFDFTLEGVLRQRKHVERERQRDLAGHQQQMRDAQDALRSLDQSLQESHADMRDNRLLGRIDLAFLAAYRRYVAAVQRRGTIMAQKMALIQRQIDSAQTALAEAARQRKIIEKLREKQFDRWKLEAARKEAAELDEVSTRLSSWKAAQEIGAAE